MVRVGVGVGHPINALDSTGWHLTRSLVEIHGASAAVSDA